MEDIDQEKDAIQSTESLHLSHENLDQEVISTSEV